MKPDRPWFIYALKDPRTDAIRYVGWTVNTNRRFKRHLRQSLRDNSYRAKWLRSLSREGIIPLMEIIETGFGSSYADSERRWISYYLSQGARLTNTTEGGDGVIGYEFTEAARAKISAAAKGRKPSPEAIAKAAASHRALGRKVTPEQRAKTSLRCKGVPSAISPEGREKLSVTARDRPVTQNMRATTSAVHKGKVLSPETRTKLSIACSGRKHTDEERAAMVNAWAVRKEIRDSFPEMSHSVPGGELSRFAKLTVAQVREIRDKHSSTRGNGYRALGKLFGVDPGTIRNVVKGRTWSVPETVKAETA